MDLICQLIVVNIVRTQGCNEMMNRYTIEMSRDNFGGLKLSFRPKPSQELIDIQNAMQKS